MRLEAVAQLGLGFSVGSESGLGVEFVGHGGGGEHGLEAARALGHVLLGVEEDHVDLGHVEQAEGHRGAQAHRDGQRGRLDVHLRDGKTPNVHNTISLANCFFFFWHRMLPIFLGGKQPRRHLLCVVLIRASNDPFAGQAVVEVLPTESNEGFQTLSRKRGAIKLVF